MIEIILGLVVFALGGGYITWQHGQRKYEEGVIMTLIDHHTGKLTYKAEGSDGKYMLEIFREE